MTYDNRFRQCSGWPSFWLDYGKIAGQLQTLKSTLHCLRDRMDLPLRNHDTAMLRNPHDGKSIHSRFTNLVSIVWRRECITKSAGKIDRRFLSILGVKVA